MSTNTQKDNKPEQKPQRMAASGGYAQALLKKSVPSTAPSSSVPPSGSTATIEVPNTTPLDAAMSQLAFSVDLGAAKAAYDDW